MKFGLLLLALYMTSPAMAQSDSVYVPPPLFNGSHLEEPDTRSNDPKPPSKSQTLTHFKKTNPNIDAPLKPPKPQVKPTLPLQNEQKSEEKDTFQGVVTGPKTMPAVKKTTVEAEATFSPKKAPSNNIMERHKQQNKDIIIERVKSKLRTSADNNSAKEITKTEWIFSYSGQDQINLGLKEKNTLLNEIVPAFKNTENKRILIYSTALSEENIINASRRLALSRALAIRRMLLEQEINPNYVDVRAIETTDHTQNKNYAKIVIKR